MKNLIAYKDVVIAFYHIQGFTLTVVVIEMESSSRFSIHFGTYVLGKDLNLSLPLLCAKMKKENYIQGIFFNIISYIFNIHKRSEEINLSFPKVYIQITIDTHTVSKQKIY